MSTTILSDSRRLQRLEDIEQIKTLKARYAEALDNRFNGEQISALFCEHGTWQVGEDQASIKGRDAIKQLCTTLANNISWSIHYFFPSVVEIKDDGISANASFYVLDLQTLKNQDNEDEAYLFAGTFKDRFIKIDDSWYFEHVYGNIDLITPWTQSWVNPSFIPDFFAKGK